MEDRVILYVAGNPDAYPLEYYDAASETYQGVLPQLLQQFASQSGYEVLYYPTEGADRRAHLAKNLQVDMVSGYRDGDTFPACEERVSLFQTSYQGREQTYYLCLTQTAPESLKSDLEAFFAAVPQETVTGILMETQAPPQAPAGSDLVIGGLALAVGILSAALFLLARLYRRRLRKAEESRETDAVTGLGNFDYLMRYYRQIVNDKNRVLYSLFYFYVDTDRLRRVGGSQETDAFLRYCAVVLQEYTANTDILAKVSDQGFVLLKFSGNMQTIRQRIQPLFHRIHTYAQTYGKPFESTITAGICSLKAEDRDLNEVIFNASQGAHEAARRQVDYVVCTEEMHGKIAEERKLQSSVDQALEDHAFTLYLQFYVDAYSSRIMGAEALSRWNHPQRGLLTPEAFIPLLEREGTISKLDYYCLKESCRFLDSLVGKGVDQFFISCNFSRETFAQADFAARCKAIMDSYRFPRELLIFELTESSFDRRTPQIIENMTELRAYGIRLALDDFGGGFTSFSDLQQYPLDGIKLDKSLIDNSMTKNGIAILRAMVQVGHELNLTILAEGVETDAQVQALRQIHCDVIQGFRFYAPIPEKEAEHKILEQFRQASLS